jgi:flagellar motor switch protein FliM
VPFKGLDLRRIEVEVREHVDLSDARGVLPQDGLIAVLEDGGGARGLIALSHGAVDALVEVQTTGRVDPKGIAAAPGHAHR